MSTQVRNASMVSLLETDFIKRNEPGNALGNVISSYLSLPGLRGFWPFSSIDENASVYDATMQGRTLTNINSVAFGNTDFLPYAEFDGSTNYLTRSDEAGLDVTGDLTIGCWVRFDSVSGGRALISKYGASGSYSYALAMVALSKIRFSVSVDGTAISSVTTTNSASADTWHFIVGKFEAGTDTIVFFDDEKKLLGSGIASIFNSTADFRIGNYASNTNYLDGQIALAFMCAYAVPDNMILNLYQQSRVLFDNQ